MSSPSASELQPPAVLPPDVVLARARAAAGGEACGRVRTLRIEGRIAAGGLSGPFEQRIDLAIRRSARTFTLGPARYAAGFDGARAWSRGPNGDVTLQDSEAGLRAAVTQAWLDARGWWSPTHGPAHAESLGVLLADERAHDVLRVTPEGGDPMQLWFDGATHLLARVVQSVHGRDSITRFDDHRDVDGVRLPFRSAAGSGDARFDRVVVADRIVLNETIAAAELEAPAAVVDDVAFVDGGVRATLAIEVIQNTIVVPVNVDGHALRFILDSGGVTLLLAETVARLGLRSEGRLEAAGAGGRSVSAGFVRVQRLVIGEAVVLANQLVHELAMPGASDVLGVRVDGLLGADLFRRLVLRIDYERQSLTLLRPQVEPEAGWGERLALTFFAHIPCVDAVLDGQPGQFWLDTGNSGAVLLHARPGGMQPALVSAVTTVGWGVGGAIRGRLARGTRLVLGHTEIDAPALRVLDGGEGALSTPGLAGNLGGAILSRFVVTFDYARNAVWLAPNGRFGAPFPLDRSGLRIHAHAGGFVVVAVMAGSPADEAGLRVGDVIVAVAGVAAEGIPLHAQRRAWQESAEGTPVRVRVERAGALVEARFVLRDLVPRA
jgi:hypothetical protein